MDIQGVFGEVPDLETRRLSLRKLRLSDADAIFEYASDPEVAKFVTWEAHRSVGDSIAFISMVLGLYKTGREAHWAIIHKDDDKVIGTCAFLDWNTTHASAEIGYALSRRYWGRGLMTEVVREMISFGFSAMKLDRIQAFCELDNTASCRVLEKTGMKCEGVLRAYKKIKGTGHDLKIYSIITRDLER